MEFPEENRDTRLPSVTALPADAHGALAANPQFKNTQEGCLMPPSRHDPSTNGSAGASNAWTLIDPYKLDAESKDPDLLDSPDIVVCTKSGKAYTTTKGYGRTLWRADRIVGCGGSATVWLQREECSGDYRAVKQIARPQPKLPPQTTPVFVREILLLVKVLSYPEQFIHFCGWYEDMHYRYIVMEYVEHGNLLHRIKSTKITQLEAKEIARQILTGLKILHGLNICHRDIKPENILVASLHPLRVKITDFGVSKEVVDTKLRTQCGTVTYNPPEIHGMLPRNKRRRFTFKLDIWSFGCLMHEVLCSETPFICTEDEELSDDEDESVQNPPSLDMTSLYMYCVGKIVFPRGPLEKANVDEGGIKFIESLLKPEPNERPSAEIALQDFWLT